MSVSQFDVLKDVPEAAETSARGGSMLQRLIGYQLAAFLVVWLVLLGLTYHEITKFGSGDFDREMGMFAEALTKIAAVETAPERVKRNAKILAELYMEYGVNYMGVVEGYEPVYQVWGPNGVMITKSDAAPSSRLTVQDEGIFEEKRSGDSWRVVSSSDKASGTTVQIAEPLSVRAKMARPLLFWFIKPLLWILPLIAAVTWISARSGLRPLSRLAQEINARDVSSNALITTRAEHAETGSIVTALNRLLQRQGALIQGQRDFLADAAHELRTPLAVISAQTHALATSETKEEFQQGISALQAGVSRAGALVKQLLAMARLEAGITDAKPVPVDIDHFVRERVASFAPEAVRKRIDIDMVSGEVSRLDVDPAHLRSVIDNLLDNSIKYCPSGSRVRVSTLLKGEQVDITVADDGPGIPVEARAKALSRFSRLAQAGEGSGLGLAIADAAARQMRGSLQLDHGLDGRGLAVTLTIPRQ